MLSISHIVLILLICIAMDRKRPRRADWSRIQELFNIGGISRAGLSELLTTLRNAPALPSGCLKHLDAAYHQRFLEVRDRWSSEGYFQSSQELLRQLH